MAEALKPGIYASPDGQRYRVMTDGSTYLIQRRWVWQNFGGERKRVQVDGSYKRVGVTRPKLKESPNALENG
jgi:hypothetical protein